MRKRVNVKNKFGIHARPATKLVELCSKFESELSIEFKNQSINLKSIMSVMALDARSGDLVTVVANGSDEKKALDKIVYLIENDFFE